MKILESLQKSVAKVCLLLCYIFITILLIFAAACGVIFVGILYMLERASYYLKDIIDDDSH